MKRFIAAIAVLILLNSGAAAETFSLDKGAVSFVAPDGFKPFSDKVIKIKYPRGRAPRHVIGTASTQTSIAYDLKPQNIPQSRIEEARMAFVKILPRIVPGLKWVDQKVIDLAGRKWVFLEMTSSAIDADIHNIMLFTGYKKQMLIFNFNSTKKEFKQYEAALRKSIQSIKIY